MISLLLLILFQVGPHTQNVQVRILEKYHPQSLVLSTQLSSGTISFLQMESFQAIESGSEVKVVLTDSILIISEAGEAHSKAVWIHLELIEPANGFVRITLVDQEMKQEVTRSYRGDITISVSDNELVLVNGLSVGDHLASVVGSEMGNAPLEALKAQAVVSRTFVYRNRHRHRSYDFCDLTHCQFYGGKGYESADSRRAVTEIRGETILYRNKLIDPVYHSTCGGNTISADQIWGGSSIPYLRSVVDGDRSGSFCQHSPHFRWEKAIRRVVLEKAVLEIVEKKVDSDIIRIADVDNLEPQSLGSVSVVTRDTTVLLSPDTFRMAVNRRLGWNTVRSNLFKLTLVNNEYRLEGRGLGHGVGMCQWGAKEMGKRGYDYRAIIAHYYSGVQIRSGIKR